jgi:uncharacterized membrane protein
MDLLNYEDCFLIYPVVFYQLLRLNSVQREATELLIWAVRISVVAHYCVAIGIYLGRLKITTKERTDSNPVPSKHEAKRQTLNRDVGY